MTASAIGDGFPAVTPSSNNASNDVGVSQKLGFPQPEGDDIYGHPVVARRDVSPASHSRAPTPVDVAVGCRIRELRRRAGLTQREMSQRVGVTGAQFHRYERGLARISTGRLMRICDALSIPLEVFMEIGAVKRESSASSDTGFQALLSAYLNIPHEAQRAALLTIARSMSRGGLSRPEDGL